MILFGPRPSFVVQAGAFVAAAQALAAGIDVHAAPRRLSFRPQPMSPE